MNEQKFIAKLKTGGLWAKTSAKGGRYLTGCLGGVKLLILANRDRQPDNDLSHILYFVDGEQRRQDVQGCGIGQVALQQPPKTRQTWPQPQRSGLRGHAGANGEDAPEWA